MRVFIAGGSGYIGSNSAAELIKEGYEVVLADNFANSDYSAVEALEKISGKKIAFYNTDLCLWENVKKIFSENRIDAIINFAALKSIGESVEKPLDYYYNNIACGLNLLKAADEFAVRVFIFSSSATVYGTPLYLPIDEKHPLSFINPYGGTKVMMEEMIYDIAKAQKEKCFVILRYFNPVGAHESMLLGEKPKGEPANLVPYITETALGLKPYLKIFGNDYDTADGTGIRDYVHITDIARGHVLAMKKAENSAGLLIYNLGTGRGYSVFEVLKAFEKATGKKIPYRIYERRNGDCAVCYASVKKAEAELGYEAKFSLDDMCRDAYAFAVKNRRL